MPTAGESRRCREVNVINNLVEGLDLQCVTEHPGYSGNCLNPYVVETYFYEFLDVYGHVGEGLLCVKSTKSPEPLPWKTPSTTISTLPPDAENTAMLFYFIH